MDALRVDVLRREGRYLSFSQNHRDTSWQRHICTGNPGTGQIYRCLVFNFRFFYYVIAAKVPRRCSLPSEWYYSKVTRHFLSWKGMQSEFDVINTLHPTEEDAHSK
jgi:hypothetical protein